MEENDKAAPTGSCDIAQKQQLAVAATTNGPGILEHEPPAGHCADPTWQVPSLDDCERRTRHIEIIADWRDELTARIARETLIFEFADYTRREEFDALEAEVSLFNQVCRAITASNPEREAA